MGSVGLFTIILHMKNHLTLKHSANDYRGKWFSKTSGGSCLKGRILCPAGKGDRRVKYTKMVLKDSFIKLLRRRTSQKSPIKEICDDADINRATFYAHYSDQYDLLRKIEDELFENINSHVTGHTFEFTETGTIDMVEHIFEYIKENAQLCKILLSERGTWISRKKIMMLYYNKDIDDQVSRGCYHR
jgi:hypothetical protein